MTTRRKAKPPLGLLLGIMIVAPAAFLIAIPWLKQQPDNVVFLLAGIAATVAVVSSFVFAVLHDRQLDEWQRSNARFSSQWGWAAGSGLVALLLAVTPFRDFIVAWTTSLAEGPEANQKLVILAFTFGFGAVVIAQTVCTALFSIGWAFWKSRPARDAS